MSDIPADLDLREQITRIDRSIAVTRKFSETDNLVEEGREFRCKRWMAPWTLLVSLLGGVGLGIVQLFAHLAGWWK
jgi:hypothetical protein